jgi:hypothetical protein
MSSFIETCVTAKRIFVWMFTGLLFQLCMVGPWFPCALLLLLTAFLITLLGGAWDAFRVTAVLTGTFIVTAAISIYAMRFSDVFFPDDYSPERTMFIMTTWIQGPLQGIIVGIVGPKRIFGSEFQETQ